MDSALDFVIQLTLCRGKLQVEIKRICTLTRFGQRQGYLARLTRPKKDNRRKSGQQVGEFLLSEPRIHPCNLVP